MGGGGSKSKSTLYYSKGDYNAAMADGFSKIESKQIAQAMALVRKSETYKTNVKMTQIVLEGPRGAFDRHYTFEGLKKSWPVTDAMETAITHAVVFNNIDASPKPEFTAKQVNYARDALLREVSIDNPKRRKK